MDLVTILYTLFLYTAHKLDSVMRFLTDILLCILSCVAVRLENEKTFVQLYCFNKLFFHPEFIIT